jgi:putative ABC transport system ATP-binding protein
MSFLTVKNLQKGFPSPDGLKSEVVDVDDFSLSSGNLCAMMGESGSGKTTFLHLLAGILKPDKGSISMDGVELCDLSDGQRDQLRASSIGYVFQSFNLLQGFTCLENVMLAMSFGRKVNKKAAQDLLFQVGLSHRMGYLPSQLSIGQQQRVALARALANNPKLILADEPTGNLDPENSLRAMELLRSLCLHYGSSLLLVSHDSELVESFENNLDWSDLNQAPASHSRPQPTPESQI